MGTNPDRRIKILTLDLATQTGWAYGTPGKPDVFGTRGLLPKGQPPSYRFKSLIKMLERLEGLYGTPDEVWYEDVKFSKGNMRIYCGLVAFLEVWCEGKSPLRGAAISAIKNIATGHGRATKEEMLLSARYKWGETVPDDNAADALWLLELARRG